MQCKGSASDELYEDGENPGVYYCGPCFEVEEEVEVSDEDVQVNEQEEEEVIDWIKIAQDAQEEMASTEVANQSEAAPVVDEVEEANADVVAEEAEDLGAQEVHEEAVDDPYGECQDDPYLVVETTDQNEAATEIAQEEVAEEAMDALLAAAEAAGCLDEADSFVDGS